MKINEIRLSSVIGDVGAAAVKSLGTGAGVKAQMAQDIFIKDFVGDAISSISTAVRSGLVDRDADTPASWTASTTATPDVKIKPADYTKANPTAAPAAPTAAPTAAPAAPTAPAAKKEPIKVGNEWIKPEDPRYDKIMGGKNSDLPESTYKKLNALFESILEESNITIPAPSVDKTSFRAPAGGGVTQGGAMKSTSGAVSGRTTTTTIAQYLEKWFDQYMEGVDWKSHLHQVKDQLLKIEQSYGNRSAAMREIERLGDMAYALSKGAAKGAQNAKGSSKGPSLMGAAGLTAGNQSPNTSAWR